MDGHWIKIQAQDNSGEFGAYLATPCSGKGPGLVILQEAFGINPHIRKMADKFAQQGYVVLAPDLFWRQEPNIQLGYTPEDLSRGMQFYHNLDNNKCIEDIQTTLNYLRQLPEVTGAKAGVLGFCLGGKLAYMAACQTDTDIAISYYGSGVEKLLDEVKNAMCPIIIHIPALDKSCPAEAQSAIIDALANRPATEVYVYPGTDHAFAREEGDHYNPQASELAHKRSIAALQKALNPN